MLLLNVTEAERAPFQKVLAEGMNRESNSHKPNNNEIEDNKHGVA